MSGISRVQNNDWLGNYTTRHAYPNKKLMNEWPLDAHNANENTFQVGVTGADAPSYRKEPNPTALDNNNNDILLLLIIIIIIIYIYI